MNIHELKGLGPLGVIRAAFRKFIYRRVEMGYYQVDAESLRLRQTPGVMTRLADPSQITLEYLGNPNMHESDLSRLRDDPDVHCLVVLDEDVVVASNWFRGGTIRIAELNQRIALPEGVYLSCWSYVSPAARGQGLLSHMLSTFAEMTPAFRGYNAFIFDWNTPSIRSAEKIGMRKAAVYWSQWIFGRQRSDVDPVRSD